MTTATASKSEGLARSKFMSDLNRAAARKSQQPPADEKPAVPAQNTGDDDATIDALDGAEQQIVGDGKTPGDGDKGRKAGDGTKPKTVEALAETLGLSVDDVYAVEVALSDGDKAERLTLGKLKDLAAKARDLDTREVAFAESRAKQENDLLRTRTELREIIAALPPGALTKATLEKVKNRQAEYSSAERERLLETIGEWKDSDREAGDRAGIKAHLEKGYGIEGAFFDRIVDHRIVKFFYDAWRRYDAVTKALSNAKEVRSKAHEPSTRTGDGARPRGQTSVNLPGRPLATHELQSVFSNLGKRG